VVAHADPPVFAAITLKAVDHRHVQIAPFYWSSEQSSVRRGVSTASSATYWSIREQRSGANNEASRPNPKLITTAWS
jgi:hypothetical protein